MRQRVSSCIAQERGGSLHFDERDRQVQVIISTVRTGTVVKVKATCALEKIGSPLHSTSTLYYLNHTVPHSTI